MNTRVVPLDKSLRHFPFPASKAKDADAVRSSFEQHGRQVADIQQEMGMWTWVLCSDGSLWLHDRSHGGGGVFTLEAR